MAPETIRVRYPGDPCRSLRFLDGLGLDLRPDRFALLVASATLEREWARIFREAPDRAPALQRTGDRDFVFLFHRVLRAVLNTPLLSRTEERVTLQRAAQTVAEDEGMARVLRQDVFAWSEALAEIDALGLDMAAPLPAPYADALVHPRVGHLLQRLQAEAGRVRARSGRRSFEAAARRFLQCECRPARTVILEGFTHADPLLTLLLDRCAAAGSTVVFLHGYRPAQSHGFAVMDRVYAPYRGRERLVEVPTGFSAGGDLLYLQEHLFADTVPQGPAPAQSRVTLDAFTHRHQEAAECVRRIQAYLRSGVRTDEIAVVMRNSYEFQPLLQEEADRQRLVDGDGRRVPLTTQPRLLLLTPLGRFVLALYQVWEGQALRLTPDQFEVIVASGWLGAQVQATTDQFASVRGQVFARCGTRAEWEAGFRTLDDLRRAGPDNGRLPSGLVRDETVRLWRGVIDQIEGLCRRLFGAPDQSIGGHIRLLLDELSRLTPDLMRQKEREVLERIRQALDQVTGATSLPMSSSEFGDVLSGLAREYAEGLKEEAEEQAGTIWCITPPGVDGYGKRIIFYLGVDDRRVPQRYAEPWPFFLPDLGAHQETERYLFLAAVRAARERLHLSYARSDEGVTYRPSVYLEEAARLLGRDLTPAATAILPVPSTPTVTPLPPPAIRERYALSEIAHYALCPFRYKLESISPSGRAYRSATDAFQLVPLAQGVWMDLTLASLETAGARPRGEAAVRHAIDGAFRDSAGAARAAFPALLDVHWRTAEKYARGALDYDVVRRAKTYEVEFLAAPPESFPIVDGDRVVVVEATVAHQVRVGLFHHPVLAPRHREEWLLPGRRPRGAAQPLSQVDGVPVFGSLYHAVQWWHLATHTAFYFRSTQAQGGPKHEEQRLKLETVRDEVRGWLPHLEGGAYPKNPGPHCSQCPVRGECMGQ